MKKNNSARALYALVISVLFSAFILIACSGENSAEGDSGSVSETNTDESALILTAGSDENSTESDSGGLIGSKNDEAAAEELASAQSALSGPCDYAGGCQDLGSFVAAWEDARKYEEYSEVYYRLTYQLVDTGAVLEWMSIYRATLQLEEKAAIQTLYDTVFILRSEMTVDSDFAAVIDAWKAAVANAGDALSRIITYSQRELPQIKGYIYDYRRQHDEDDVAHAAWGEARAVTVYAYEALVVAGIENIILLAEALTPQESESINHLLLVVANIRELAAELAGAKQSFDDVKTTTFSNRLTATISDVETIIVVLQEKILAAYAEVNGPVV